MSASAVLSAILAALKSDVLQALIPPLVTFLQNVKGLDPLSLQGALGFAAQLDLLRSTLTSDLLKLEPAEIVKIETEISNELQAWLQKAAASAAAPVAKPAS